MRAMLQIDDDLFDLYEREAKERRMDVGDVLRERLKKAVALDPRDRGVVISGGRTRFLIEEMLGGGFLKDQEDLATKIRKLAVIKFGEHSFRLTAGHYQELQHRALKTGRTMDELIAEIFRKMQETFFDYVP